MKIFLKLIKKIFHYTGKYKYFFGDSYARGFVNGFSIISYGEYETNSYYDETAGNVYENNSYTDFALRFGVSGKFVTKGGFLLDLSTGIYSTAMHQPLLDNLM